MRLFTFVFSICFSCALAYQSVTITFPIDGETYCYDDSLSVRAIIENENEMAESVIYSLNSQPDIEIPRLNTDWYTYMQNDLHHGYSESPAPHEPTVLWAASVSSTDHEFCSPVVANGIVYFGCCGQQTIFALDALTGDIIWSHSDFSYFDDAFTYDNDTLFVSADSLWCLDALTGERFWAYLAPDESDISVTPAVDSENVYTVGKRNPGPNSRVYAIDRYTGIPKWSTDYDTYFFESSAVTLWNELLFVAFDYGPLVALNSSDGSIVWENMDALPNGYWDSSPTVVDSIIYITAQSNGTYAIEALTGTTIWVSLYGIGEATPAVHAGKIYTSTAYGQSYGALVCLDTTTGDSLWTSNDAGYEYLHGSPGVADGLVFWGNFIPPGAINATDSETGELVWTFLTSKDFELGVLSSPAITDGIMYIAASDNYLYAFGTGLKYTYSDNLFSEVGYNELIVTAYDSKGVIGSDTISFTVTEFGIEEGQNLHLVLRNRPNPFASTTEIEYALDVSGHVLLEVYDITGRLVQTIFTGEAGEGLHAVIWDSRDSRGHEVSSGVYFCRLVVNNSIQTGRMCILR